jgi:glycine hydroxymethyltransferase
METVVDLIDRVIINHTNESIIEEVADIVGDMMGERPIFVF